MLVVFEAAAVPGAGVMVTFAAGPAVLVRMKLTVPDPVVAAETLYAAPGVVLAVKADELVWPLAPMVAVEVRVPLFANVPEPPLAGAVKVTVAPLTGLPNWSRSWTTSG